jgi:putative nucleotidyltransferase-like protein
MPRSDHQTRKGQLVARMLAGSWRMSFSSPLSISEAELDEVTPLLYGSGAAALGWWRLRQTDRSATPSAVVLQQAYRLQALQAAIHEQKLEKVFRLLRQASVDAVLAKGWAAAALYPDPALRPYGDIDLCIRPEHFIKAQAVLTSPEASDCWVDLHKAFSEINDRSFEDLFSRSRRVTLGFEQIRILGAEDQLALQSVHLLKHGAWRPVWLCDIGATIEALPEGFSWDVCFGKKGNRANWICSAILLAHELLEANIDSLPISKRPKSLPAWLIRNVLVQWVTPFALNQPPMSHPVPMGNLLHDTGAFLHGIRHRWPNPIIATVSTHGNFNNFPRLPYQIGNWVLRAAQFLSQLPSKPQSPH